MGSEGLEPLDFAYRPVRLFAQMKLNQLCVAQSLVKSIERLAPKVKINEVEAEKQVARETLTKEERKKFLGDCYQFMHLELSKKDSERATLLQRLHAYKSRSQWKHTLCVKFQDCVKGWLKE
jgi:hypothetical protein